MGLPGVREIDIAGRKAWPGVEREHDGSWVRRAGGGYTRRANSVQCLDPADDENVVARIAASRRWFETRGLRPVFRITPLTGPRLRAALDATRSCLGIKLLPGVAVRLAGAGNGRAVSARSLFA